MSKILFVLGVLTYMLTLGVEMAQAQQVNLNTAIRNAATRLSTDIDNDSMVAVLSMESGSARMSYFLVEETITALSGTGRFGVANPFQQNLFARGLEFSIFELDAWESATELRRYVDIESRWGNISPVGVAQAIGRLMDVQFIVMGTLTPDPFGGFFRLRMQVIEVETAVIRVIYTANVEICGMVVFLLTTPPLRVVRAPVIPATPGEEEDGALVALTPLGLLGGLFAPREPSEPRTPREPRARATPTRRNWISAEATLIGGGIRYERNINNTIALGAVAWGGLNMFGEGHPEDGGWPAVLGGMAASRFFLFGSPLYLELGLGFGIMQVFERYNSFFWYESRTATGLMVAPGIGARFGGRTGAFFVNPFISFPFVFGHGSALRAGVGFGFAF